MITLVSSEANLHCFFERQRGQLVFRWIVFTPEMKFKSDWQSISDAKGIDQHLIREFISRLNSWTSAREKHPTDVYAYLEAFKQAILGGKVFEPPVQWAELHQTYFPYHSAKDALTEQLVSTHPSVEFCTVQLEGANQVQAFFTLCRGRVWSSPEWLAPRVWLEHASSIFPIERSPVDANGGRSIPADIKREVWRRDNGRCAMCGSKEKLEFDHIIPFSKGGSNTVRNVQLLCEPCNRQKGSSLQ